MQINKLYIKNFRGFEERTFNLNPLFTVAIGDNGTGKSTLLHAMQVASGSFFLGLPYASRRNISENEIRFAINRQSKQSEFFTPTIVEATGFINGSGVFSWRRMILEHGKSTAGDKSTTAMIRNIAEEYASSLNEKGRPMLPIIVYFGVKQLGGTATRKRRIKKDRIIIRDGYYNAFGAKSDEDTFTQWFYYYNENLEFDLEFKGTYEAVINAIETAIPYLKNVAFDNFRLELVADCEIEGQKTKRLPHSLMSDGVKRMLGIVTDIAYRCIVLNGFKGEEAVKATSGIVMIDELDMHLHPNWQRTVVADLKKAFPKIQFVVTTHSPFIVQSLKSDELINLDALTDIAPNELKIDQVATEVMGVDSVYSVEGEKKYNQAKRILNKINTGTNSDSIKNEIADVSDPILQAFLEANRIAKGNKP